MWYWVSLSYATYGIKIERGICVDAAPIAKWMIGNSNTFCRAWIRNKGGIIRALP